MTKYRDEIPGIIAKPAPTAEASESARRKGMPLFDGFLMYFPDACLAVSEHSRKGNDKHNPGEPLHWSKDKSKDHANCIARHLIDLGPTWDAVDPEFGSLHATALAWRAMALLQTVLERQRAKAELERQRAKAEPAPAEKEEESQWIPWNGVGLPPLSLDTIIDVKFRDGYVCLGERVGRWDWKHHGIIGDIIAYRVVKQT